MFELTRYLGLFLAAFGATTLLPMQAATEHLPCSAHDRSQRRLGNGALEPPGVVYRRGVIRWASLL